MSGYYSTSMKAAIIINPVSGARGRAAGARADLARRALADAGAEGEVVVTERHGHARESAAALARSGVDLIVAWGGDGTISEVGSALVFTPAALGIVPAGSGNGLARELGLSMRPAEALRAALGGRPRPLDVGELAGRYFLNIGGIGFDAVVAARFNERPSGRRGAWPYITLTLGALAGYEPDRYRVTLDCPAQVEDLCHRDPAPVGDLWHQEHYEGRFFTVVFANSPQFGNRMRVAPEAVPDDGLLNALLVDHRSVLGHVWRARHLLWDPLRARGIVRRPVRAATIEGTAPLRCQIDGESFTASGRVEARVHPGALTLRM